MEMIKVDFVLDDIWSEHLLPLLNPADLAAVRLVHPEWRRLVDRTLPELSPSSHDSPLFCYYVRRFPGLKLLEIALRPTSEPMGLGEEDVRALSRMMVLKTLIVRNMSPAHLPIADNLGELRLSGSLRQLYIHGMSIKRQSGLRQINQLQELKLRNCRLDDLGAPLPEVLRGWTSLTRLCLERCWVADGSVLRGVSELRNLQHLKLHMGLANVDDLLTEVGQVRKLKTLDMDMSNSHPMGNGISLSGLQQLQALSTSLRALNLHGVGYVKDAGLQLLASLTRLTALDVTTPRLSEDGEELLEEIPLVWSPRRINNTGLVHRVQISHLESQRRISNTGAGHLGRLSQLEHLAVGGAVMTEPGLKLLGQLEALRSLDISKCPFLNNDAAMFALRPFKQLSHLDLDGMNAVTNAGLRAVCQLLPNLSSLNLGGRQAVTCDATLHLLGSSMRNLRRLSLAFCDRITDWGLQLLLEHNSRISTLNLRDCHQITDHGIRLLAEGLPQLEMLDLSHCYQVTRSGVDLLMKLGSLQQLNILGTRVGTVDLRLLRRNSKKKVVSGAACWWMASADACMTKPPATWAAGETCP